MMIFGILAVVVIAIACTAVVIVGKVKKLNAFMDSFQLGGLNLAAVADGAYQGEADAGIIQVTVCVTVKDHTIAGIELLRHKNGQGKAAESITGSMVRKQKIAVDAVSGATLSSRVIQKAVENALAGGSPVTVSGL